MMFVDGVDTHRIGFVPEDVFAWTRLELWKIEEAMGINGFVGKKRLDVQDFVETGFKCQDQSRIELTAGFFNNVRTHLLDAPGWFVRAAHGQRIKHLGNGADTSEQGNGFTRQPKQAALAVIAFVVADDDAAGGVDQRAAPSE